MKRLISKTGFLLILFVVVSCVDRPTTYDPDFHDREIISDEGDFVLAEETIILPESTLQLLSNVSEDGSVYTFNSRDAVLDNLRNNQILIFGISEQTPDGALRRITSTQSSGGSVSVTTTDAALEEAFEELFIQVNEPLTPDQVQKMTIEIPSMNVLEEYDQQEFHKMSNRSFLLSLEHKFYPFDNPADRDTSIYVKTTGSIEIEPQVDFLLDIGFFRLNELKMVIENKVNNQIKVETNFNDSLKKEVVIYTYYFVPLTFGPVVFTPILKVLAGVEGSVTVGIESFIGMEVVSEAGLHFTNGNWNTISDFTTDFDASMSDLFLNAFLKAYLGPRIDFFLYGSAGPYVNVLGFGEISVDTRRQSELQIHAGVEANAGAEVRVFSKTLAKFEVNDLYSLRWLVFEKSFANPPTVNTSSVTNITPSTATSGGTITDTGGADITQRGICWSTSQNPDINDTCTDEGSGSGSFTSFLSALSSDTRYYVRAYAENSAGIGYGQQETFVTQESDDRDFDMNICDVWQVAQSGGVGVTVDNWDISEIPPGATFDIRFEAYNIPDKFVIEYPAGTVQHDTGWRGSSSFEGNPRYPGGIAGPGRGQENDLFTKGTHDMFRVVVTGVDNGTLWNYQVRCRYN